MSQEPQIIIQQVEPGRIIDLRHAVLRAGLPRESAIFAGDDAPQSAHFAAIRDQAVVGCVSLLLNNWNNQPAWQLRGMAVQPSLQRSGIGSQLLNAVDQHVLASPVKLLWCNARVPAAGFYRRHGWEIASDLFEVPTAGPHYKMIKLPM